MAHDFLITAALSGLGWSRSLISGQHGATDGQHSATARSVTRRISRSAID